VGCAFYGDLFRPPGGHLAAGDRLIRAEDLDLFERDLLAGWWGEAARTDAAVIAPDARTLARAPPPTSASLPSKSRTDQNWRHTHSTDQELPIRLSR
jgi:hypothetical protein